MNLKRVELFLPFANIRGWFTKKNSDLIGKDHQITGLNCGLHPGADPLEIENNRHLLFEELEIDPDRVAFARQVHKDRVQTVNAGGLYPETDALITQKYGLTLAIQVADCAAVLIAEPDRHIIAAVHAGWRGAIAGIIPKTIEHMRRNATARPDRMLVYISPCISQQFFEVGEEVAEKFPDRFIDSESFDKDHVDLKGFVIQQLKDAGIPAMQIHSDPDCTYRDAEDYYSFRREKEKAGRMLALIQLV
jgi:polyphenol oxidase